MGEKTNASEKDNKAKSNRMSGQSNELYEMKKRIQKKVFFKKNNYTKRDDAPKKMLQKKQSPENRIFPLNGEKQNCEKIIFRFLFQCENVFFFLLPP